MINYEVVDVTTGSEVALAAPFSVSTSGTTWTLTISSTDVSDAGTYTLRIKAQYDTFPLSASSRDFDVELTDPCSTATLSIDDTIFVTPLAVILTQYVNYG